MASFLVVNATIVFRDRKKYQHTVTTRKQALGPPQKYRYGDEPVPMLA